jgi:hypothetical protein
MALRAADKAKKAQEKWRQQDREVHKIAQVNVRVPIGFKDSFKRFGQLLRDGKKPSEAFEAAFPKGHAALLRAAKQRKQEGRPGRGAKNTPAAPAAGSASAGPAKPKRRAQPRSW